MNSRRTQITLAEQLFGFVESDAPSLGTESPHSPQDKRIKALAGRVKFSSGRLCSDHHDSEQVYLPEVKLQILSSPKLPCPALYFKRSNGRPGGIPKSQLPPVPQPHIEPQGRKTYLIHDPRLARWSTSQPDKHLEQKVRVRPLKAGVDFVFDLSFDNLSETELGLLLLSLKPNDQFRHRIGLGKPLGLGTVEILPVGLFLVDRKTRYAADPLNSKRYHQVLLSSTASGVLLNLAHAAPDVAARYQSEQLALRGATDASRWPMLTQAARQRLQDLRLPTLQAVEALGDPATTIGMPVIYPQIPNSAVLPPNQRGAHSEEELFQWHTENERRGENLQYLQPLTSTQPKPQPLQKRVER